MVVGNGMIARAFKQYENDDQITIFASGVSNSKEIDQKEFDREEQLLKSIKKDTFLVYFSTCSVNDPSLQKTPYVRHKMVMETCIKWWFKKSIIFRLPNVVGHTSNPYTFFNHFKDKIINNLEISVQINASRYLIDIDDLVTLLPDLIEKYKNNNETEQKKINISFDNREMVINIVEMMMQILQKKSPIITVSGGCDYQFDRKMFKEYLESENYQEPENYTYNLLKKYLHEYI